MAGRSVGRVVRALYCLVEGRAGAGAQVIGSWDGWPSGLEPAVEAVGVVQAAVLSRCLAMPARGCDRAPEQWVYHVVFRTAPQDRWLSDDEWARLSTAAMDRTGIAPAEDLAACRWVAIRGDHPVERDRVHIVATLAREDGRAPQLWRDYFALGEVAREFERHFGLRGTGAAAVTR